MDLSKLPEDDLKKELKRREHERCKQYFEERQRFSNLVVDNVDALLELVTHSRTSCTDETPVNDDKCLRCALIEAKDQRYWSADYTIDFVMRFDPIPTPI